MSYEGFPYKECLEKHTLDFCLGEKNCKELHTYDNGQTYYCSIVMSKLEKLHPLRSSKEAEKNERGNRVT